MKRERVLSYLASEEGRDEVIRAIDDARDDGIKVVPTFVFDGRYVIEGGQPASTFLQLLEEVQRQSLTEREAVVACVDDSCEVPA